MSFFSIMISHRVCSAWLYLNMNPWRWLLPLQNLRGFQHHILTAISGTICSMLADITRLWTDLTLKCFSVLYILILFNCGRGLCPQISTVIFKQMFQSKKKDNMIFHLIVAFLVTIWSFLCPWLPIWGVKENFKTAMFQ